MLIFMLRVLSMPEVFFCLVLKVLLGIVLQGTCIAQYVCSKYAAPSVGYSENVRKTSSPVLIEMHLSRAPVSAAVPVASAA